MHGCGSKSSLRQLDSNQEVLENAHFSFPCILIHAQKVLLAERPLWKLSWGENPPNVKKATPNLVDVWEFHIWEFTLIRAACCKTACSLIVCRYLVMICKGQKKCLTCSKEIGWCKCPRPSQQQQLFFRSRGVVSLWFDSAPWGRTSPCGSCIPALFDFPAAPLGFPFSLSVRGSRGRALPPSLMSDSFPADAFCMAALLFELPPLVHLGLSVVPCARVCWKKWAGQHVNWRVPAQ